jgi:NADPH:quinone reductase-like Zn-dependent oxidoreductase
LTSWRWASRPPGRGEVVVAVHATAISPFDLKRTAGMMGRDDRLSPLRLGNEASGVVTAVGGDVAGLDGESLAAGDEVFGHWLPGAQPGRTPKPQVSTATTSSEAVQGRWNGYVTRPRRPTACRGRPSTAALTSKMRSASTSPAPAPSSHGR